MPRSHFDRERQYLRSHQVAKIFGVSKRALIKWVETGRIPAPEQDPDNGFYLWRVSDIPLISALTGRAGGQSR